MTLAQIWVMRPARYLCMWRNPMARRIDRAESAIALVLLLALALSFPVASWVAKSVYHIASIHAQSQRASGRYIKAILLDNVPPVAGVDGAVSQPRVRARWTAQDGTKRVETIPVAAGARAGSTARIWIDSGGHRAASPSTSASLIAEAVGAALLIVGGAAVIFEIARRAARSALDRARLTGWDTDWYHVGPHWTRPGR